ncbi:MAG: glycine--tRNA ligase subunit beta [Candidatus Acetothermia bacterium]
MSEDLLFELGTEEIPPSYLPTIADNFRKDIEESFEEALLEFGDVRLYYTPRRLAVRVSDLREVGEDALETHRGPSEEVGLDETGEYGIPAKKFAESHGATTEDLYLKETEEGTYFFVDERIEGKKTRDLLPDILPEVVMDLDQPETTRWDDSGLSFIRPIRWIVCLYGDEVIDLSLGNLSSSRYTRGHRFHGSAEIEVDEPGSYESLLEENYVIPDPDKREQVFQDQLESVTSEKGTRSAADKEFHKTLVNSLEYPSAVVGSFPEEFLELPEELLVKTLTGEARLIPLENSDGEPVASFVGFRDGSEEAIEGVKDGYQSVIYARLRDSKFFFEHDRERPLEDYVAELSDVTYQKELGSIREKVERMRRIAGRLSQTLEGLDTELVDRTVLLSKADLVTEVVDEFPSLEGTIGSHYAELDGEPEEVVRGIAEHYQPRKSSDDTPESQTGIATSIADKLDTLYGSFLIGEEPSGTRDPYGLRRKADGIIRTAIEAEIDLDLMDLIKFAGSIFDLDLREDTDERLAEYFDGRIDQVLELNFDLPYDVVDSANIRNTLNPYDTYLRANSLREFKQSKGMKDLVDSFTRLVNITEGERAEGFDTESFELEEEEELWRTVSDKEGRVEDLLEHKAYGKLIEELLSLKEPIDSYFDNVMVMAKDERLRENRLGFLNYLKEFFFNVGDLSKIVNE